MATIQRFPLVDDDGSGQTGTPFNNAWQTRLFDAIDAALAAVTPPAGITDAPNDGLAYLRRNAAWAYATWPGSSTGLLGAVGQLPFPATQSASADPSTLDDYKEGTFVPTDLSGAGLAWSYSAANYVKIGQLVFVAIEVRYPTTSDTKTALVGTLPYAVFSSGVTAQALAIGYVYGGNNTPFTASISAGQTWVSFRLWDAAGSQLTNQQMSGRYVNMSGCYRTNA